MQLSSIATRIPLSHKFCVFPTCSYARKFLNVVFRSVHTRGPTSALFQFLHPLSKLPQQAIDSDVAVDARDGSGGMPPPPTVTA
jgi:hypothetical protein